MPFPRKFSVMVSYFYDFTIKEQACKADFACQRPNMPQGNRIPAPLPGALSFSGIPSKRCRRFSS